MSDGKGENPVGRGRGRGRGRGDRGVPGRARARGTNLTIDMPPGGMYTVQCTLYTCTLYYALFYLSIWISIFSGRAAHRRGMAPSCSSRSLQTEVSIVSSSSGEDDDEWDPTWKVEWWNGSEVYNIQYFPAPQCPMKIQHQHLKIFFIHTLSPHHMLQITLLAEHTDIPRHAIAICSILFILALYRSVSQSAEGGVGRGERQLTSH